MGKRQMLRLLASVVAVTTTLVMGIPRGSAATINIIPLHFSPQNAAIAFTHLVRASGGLMRPTQVR
jgi:hypothetical protein